MFPTYPYAQLTINEILFYHISSRSLAANSSPRNIPSIQNPKTPKPQNPKTPIQLIMNSFERIEDKLLRQGEQLKMKLNEKKIMEIV